MAFLSSLINLDNLQKMFKRSLIRQCGCYCRYKEFKVSNLTAFPRLYHETSDRSVFSALVVPFLGGSLFNKRSTINKGRTFHGSGFNFRDSAKVTVSRHEHKTFNDDDDHEVNNNDRDGSGYESASSSDNREPKRFSLETKVERTAQIREENREIISRLLGVPPSSVGMVGKIPTVLINEKKAIKTYQTLQEFGFSSTSVQNYPRLVIMPSSVVENYVRIMQESCFTNINEALLLRFVHLCRSSISKLQSKMLVPSVNMIIDRACLQLEESESFQAEFMKSLPKDSSRLTLFELRSELIAAYLTKNDLGTPEELRQVFATYPRLQYRSLNWIKTNFELMKELGFTIDKIRKHLYVLHTNSLEFIKIVHSITSLGGMSLRTICQRRPKILMNTCESLLEIEKSLVFHNIPFESVQKYPEIYTLAPATIQQRLNEIDQIPEFQLLKTHPRIARLLYYHNKAKSRLEEFRSVQLRVPSLHFLSADTKRYQKSLRGGDLRIRGVDVMIYLAETFNVSKKRIRESLTRHPHWLHIPLLTIQESLQHLRSIGNFTTNQLIDAIPLLLYPLEKVQKGIEIAKDVGGTYPEDPYFLQMVLYFIERSSHFSGDAVWSNNVDYGLEDDVDQANSNETAFKKQEG